MMKAAMPAVQSRHSDEEIQAAVRAMGERKTYSQGDELEAFEAEFAAYLGDFHAVGVSSNDNRRRQAARLRSALAGCPELSFSEGYEGARPCLPPHVGSG